MLTLQYRQAETDERRKAVGFPYIEGGPNGGVGVGWWPEYIKDVKFAGRVTAKKDCVQFTAPSTTSG